MPQNPIQYPIPQYTESNLFTTKPRINIFGFAKSSRRIRDPYVWWCIQVCIFNWFFGNINI
jgi:hypothetical protein